ncbi:hypothetical protein L202_06757 [Cryptococcus amylolentus CBS 6039]|uniref:DUF1746 domain-containing protein n=2 Tax=Cryptococcus amylolentus TaxID=104669 RepID=A0A1E3HFZ2_9TREE|nr:hypothetical protein L202_06757 [Cryptococcus amylolentus CBS 6039]ODN74341.1 hypothetical protein L202_06757 [Cryptococcus amylolentus CBS 6039]ODO01363.1 hypothetical protein I350_06182 [Cryptococcus amylolentus CBS 6273]
MPPRKRNAAQRKATSEDEPQLSPAEIIDEQEQDNEIAALRKKNTEENRQSQNALDVGVLTSIFITAIQIYNFRNHPNPIFLFLNVFHLVMLPFSLTPEWLPSSWKPYLLSPSNHLLLVSVHLTTTLCALFLRYQQTPVFGQEGGLEFGEVARWALPTLVVGAVEMQRRAERETDAKIRLLEGLRYDVKGA